LTVCLEEHVPVVSFFWGDPARYLKRVHAAGRKIFLQVGSVEAAAAGVDIIIAQGTEAGGHVEGETATMVLAPRIVDAGRTRSGRRGWRHRRSARTGGCVSAGS